MTPGPVEINGITYPDPNFWIPNLDQLMTSAQGLMDVCSGALQLYGRNDYELQVITHGDQPRWTAGKENPPKQIIVAMAKTQLGQAGSEQYQFIAGVLGKLGFNTVGFNIELVNPWPRPVGGTTASQPDDEDILAAGMSLWRDAWIVWSALKALAGGAIKGSQVFPIPQDNLMVGPMQPKGPQGGAAGVEMLAQVQI